jgi:hypothetical protein
VGIAGLTIFPEAKAGHEFPLITYKNAYRRAFFSACLYFPTLEPGMDFC